jgi:hypothetical protein
MKNLLFKYLNSLVIFFLCISLTACKQNSSEPFSETQQEQLPESNVIPLTKLSPESEETTASWKFYKEFENDLRQINPQNLHGEYAIVERMVATADSLSKNIPEIVNNNVIRSRTRVLNTRIKLLQQALRQQNQSVTQKNWEELITAYNQLVNQINVRFEKLKIDQITQTDVSIKNHSIRDSISAGN